MEQLTDQQMRFFDEFGYLVFPGALKSEMPSYSQTTQKGMVQPAKPAYAADFTGK